MKPTRKRDQQKFKKQEAKTRSKPTKNEVKTESQEKQEEGPKEAGKGRTQTATTQPPTHYESLRFVPGLQFDDPKRQEGFGVMALATPAVPPAADCGTASPCGGRLYGGPARGLTFGLLPNKWIKQSPIRHLRGMRRDPRIRLDPQTVEAIARRVVELLEKRGLQRREMVDAAELARRFGIERSWVYSHAIELGAVKLGAGAKPRLRFDPEIAARVLRKVDDRPAADPPARSGKRAGQPQGSEGRVELLPIRGSGESGPPPTA
jgi:hypothetical protein